MLWGHAMGRGTPKVPLTTPKALPSPPAAPPQEVEALSRLVGLGGGVYPPGTAGGEMSGDGGEEKVGGDMGGLWGL